MGYWVYILYSPSSEKYYIGQSKNPEKRLLFHNTIEKGFTSRYRPWELLFNQEFDTRQEARQIESMIKSWKNKEKVIRLIKGEIQL